MMGWVNHFRPPMGIQATVLLLALAVAMAMLLYLRTGSSDGQPWSRWQRSVLLTLRLLAIALIGWMLAGPSFYESSVASIQPGRLIILADTSASMNEKDIPWPGEAAISRWQWLARTWLSPAYLQELSQRAQVQLLGFDESLRPLSQPSAMVQPQGQATALFHAISQSTHADSTGSPGVLLVLSDGHDTQRDRDVALASQLLQKGWEIHVAPVGSSATHPDVSLLAWSDAHVVYEGQSTVLHARITQAGLADRTVRVELWEQDRLLQSQPLAVAGRSHMEARFTVRPASASASGSTLHSYRLRVEPVPGETRLDNNERWVFVQSLRDRIKVALFEGQPHWDSRFLARTLREDAQVELTTLTAMGADRMVIQGGRWGDRPQELDLRNWVTADRLREFDVVILGKQVEPFFGDDRAGLLADYVQEQGRALILARGQPMDADDPAGAAGLARLDVLTPVQWGQGTFANLGLDLTDLGRSSPLLQFDDLGPTDQMLARLPDMLTATRVVREKAATMVLLRQKARQEADAPMAALAYQQAGQGRVLAVLSEGLWRWAFLPRRLQEYESVYQVFWARVIRWMAGGSDLLPGQSLSLSLDRLASQPGEPITATLAVRYAQADLQPRLQVRQPDGSMVESTLLPVNEPATRYRTAFVPQLTGVYECSVSTRDTQVSDSTLRLAVYDQSVERQDTSARPQNLIELAQATGGKIMAWPDRQKLLDALTQRQQIRTPDRQSAYQWNRPWLLAGLLLILGSEWFFRRRWGGR